MTEEEIGRERSEAITSREGAWHQSKVSTILDVCARQYGLEYVLKIPTQVKPWSAAGTAYHAGCEFHENARKDGKDPVTYEQQLAAALEYLDQELAGIPADVWGDGDNPDDMRSQVEAATYHFWHTPTKNEGKTIREHLLTMTPVVIEGYFRVPLVEGTLPLGGWFDGLYQKADGSLTLIDHKTANSFSNWKPDGEGHRNQAAFYSAALVSDPSYSSVTTLLPMEYLVVRKTRGKGKFEGSRIVIVAPDLADVANLGARVREAQAVLDTESYVRNPSSNLCSQKFCPFYDRCEGAQGDRSKGDLWLPWPEVKAAHGG
jgi:hypothetical protein